MLTRRGFAGCALCALTGFVATAAEGQSGNTTPGLKRAILSRIDGPMAEYETVTASVELEPGAAVARHTHPGIESGYVIEGETTLSIDGQPPKTMTAGQAFQVPTGVPHSATNGGKPTKLVSTYVVEKGKPLASPA
jgi:quercetin dioxygenase-like cupin family protein